MAGLLSAFGVSGILFNRRSPVGALATAASTATAERTSAPDFKQRFFWL